MHLIFLLLFISSVCCSDNKITFPEREAKDGEFPWVVLIRRFINQLHGDKNWCGGILYSAIHVLTAAVCVADRDKMRNGVYKALGSGIHEKHLEMFTVYAGTVNADGSGGESRKIKKLMLPYVMQFKHGMLQQNLAILVLKQGFPLSEKILTAPMMNFDAFGHKMTAYQYYRQNHTYCLLAGWGYTNATKHKFENVSGFAPAKKLKITKFRPSSTEFCRRFLCMTKKEKYCTQFGFSNSYIICAFPVNDTIDSCEFDEGGPLICDGQVAGILAYIEHEIGCGGGGPSGFVSGHYIKQFLDEAFKGLGNALKGISYYMITSLLVMLKLLTQ